MSKWKCGICNSEFDNFQAQGFGETIYCPLCYFKELYRRTKIEIDRLNKEYERIYNENCKLRENHNINDITLLDENERLNNIINRIDNFVDRTIEVIKQQPSDNDEWILERLNGIKYLTELKENNK